MPGPLVALAIQEGIGLGAGLLDTLLGSVFGWGEDSNIRRALDVVDNISMLNSLAEYGGILSHPIASAGVGWQFAEGAVPFLTPLATSKLASTAASTPKWVNTAYHGYRQYVQPIAAQTFSGLDTARKQSARMANQANLAAQMLGAAVGSTQTTSAAPAQGPMPVWAYPAGQSLATQDLLRQAVANYPRMLAESARLQAMRDLENARAMQAIYNQYLRLIPQMLPVYGNYPLY